MQYVILPPDAIGEVMRGERTTLPVIVPAPIGATVAIKRARNRRPTCVVVVTACELDPPDGYALTIRVAPLEHEPLLLAQDSSRGYTSDPRLAMRGEPEAVDLGTLNTRWGIRAGRKHEKATTEARDQAQRSRELLSVEQRMIDARRAAKLNHVDVSSELDLVRKHISGGRSPESVARRLAAAERVVYRPAA